MRIILSVVSYAVLMLSTFGFGSGEKLQPLYARTVAIDSAVPNDNRKAAGQTVNGALQIQLEARTTGWRPDAEVDSFATVMAFAEAGRPATIPGPLIRVRAGTTVMVTLSNKVSTTPLEISGLRAGSIPNDTLTLAPGETRTVTFTPPSAGTFMYWGAVPGTTITQRRGRDSQLTGAIIVDPATGPIDRDERILVMTLIDIYPDTAKKQTEEIWETAINGQSWPHTERFRYNIGDTVRWRWVNGTNRTHPMHLHGFHFQVTSKGNGRVDSVYTRENTRLAVTELASAGSTFSMKWVPARAGNWLMHCHMVPHIAPYPERKESTRAHDGHDLKSHPEQSMAGLIIGITTVEPRRVAFWRKATVPLLSEGSEEDLRLFVQQERTDSGQRSAKSYVLQRGAEPARDSVEPRSSTIFLTRGRTTRITVINRLTHPTTIHWHGLELESVYDGVSGWSGTERNLAPLLAPGDSFTVVLTPPRAGTYMYHTHMDEEDQLNSGLYGPIIVQEPGNPFDSSRDLIFIHGLAITNGKSGLAVNGSTAPAPITVEAGTTYRLRFINIMPAGVFRASVTAGADTLPIRRVAKDGADLPPNQMITVKFQRVEVGEAYDYEWTPQKPMDVTLNFTLSPKFFTQQQIVVTDKR